MQHSLSGPNGQSPEQMTAEARLAELGRIVAAGILRIRQQSSAISASHGDSSLAILPVRSVSRLAQLAATGGR
jgi:hypothetical protein